MRDVLRKCDCALRIALLRYVLGADGDRKDPAITGGLFVDFLKKSREALDLSDEAFHMSMEDAAPCHTGRRCAIRKCSCVLRKRLRIAHCVLRIVLAHC